MEISNLVEELVEKIFCKLPFTSLRAVRLTCKKWNSISKNRSFAEKHISKAARELSVIMVIGQKVCLMGLRININKIPSINRKAELVSLDNVDDQVDISRVFHCDGLLLCSTKQEGLVVWNPYLEHTRWIISPRNSDHIPYHYFMGYNKVMNNTRSHKILRFYECYVNTCSNIRTDGYEIYDFKYKSWRSLDITGPYWDMELRHRPRGVSVKGNTYWYCKERIRGVWLNFLICFDFTREKFGPRMSLPCANGKADNVVLSSVREEKLVVLVERWDTLEMEIWVTSEKIDESTMVVSWSKVLLTVKKIDKYCPSVRDESFLFDEENKVVVFLDKDKDKRRDIAHIFGVDGYLGEVDLGEFTSSLRLLFSYVPSLVDIK